MHNLKPLFSGRIYISRLSEFPITERKILRGFMITTVPIVYGTSNISDSVILIVRLIISDWQTIGWAIRSRREMLYTISFSRATLKNDLQCRASCIQTKTEACHNSFEMSNIQYSKCWCISGMRYKRVG